MGAPSTARLELGGVVLDVVKKDIKNVHLSVYPPAGRVRISAPLRMNTDTIRVFAISKLGWIRRQQRKLQAQERETPREYLDRESHYVWGRRYLLRVVEKDAPPAVELKHRTLLVQLRPGADAEKKQAVLDAWYREQVKAAVPPLIAKWSPLLGVGVERFFVQRMKTRWGGCRRPAGNIRLNAELAKKPPECLEYIVVHEMVHLLEPTHNRRFVALMDQYMPKWRFYRDVLNRLPVRHETWGY
jgi:predicted metal-dependent hydrolase